MTANIGISVPRRDLPAKLTGEAKYAADVQLPGMLVGKILRSPHPHARIVSIDASGAEGMDGVHAVVTPFDAPPWQYRARPADTGQRGSLRRRRSRGGRGG